MRRGVSQGTPFSRQTCSLYSPSKLAFDCRLLNASRYPSGSLLDTSQETLSVVPHEKNPQDCTADAPTSLGSF
ncbi:MAG: hypothetical protein RMX68_013685 [Aulosira sp. ZfuVER01]|nr:hypothetical protein [Aulosira sp. ZfuVER01]MDZ8001172.1 hypothetical protein [Aulosira sp. DedVER01a]MDZ8053124.1 hypothetical protein [Aulosira sp. ZfuCHP01]